VLVVAGLVGSLLVYAEAYEGRAALVTIVTDPFWIPLQVAQSLGVLLVVAGGAHPLRRLYDAGAPVLAAVAAASAAVAVLLDLVEFTIAALAAPGVFVRPLGTMLSPTEVEVIVMGYQAIGIGLLTTSAAFFATTFVLVGVAMYRTGRYHWSLAATGVLIGVLLVIAWPLQHGLLLGTDTALVVLDRPLGVITVLWVLAIGIDQVRSRPAGE
jgi:hypothetical protein